MIVSLFIKNG